MIHQTPACQLERCKIFVLYQVHGDSEAGAQKQAISVLTLAQQLLLARIT